MLILEGSKLTARVTRLGWDEMTLLCRNQLQARNLPKKRGAYPKSGAPGKSGGSFFTAERHQAAF